MNFLPILALALITPVSSFTMRRAVAPRCARSASASRPTVRVMPTRAYSQKHTTDFTALTTAHFEQLRKKHSASGGVLTTFTILEHEQKGAQPHNQFKFATMGEPQTLVYAVRDNCPRIFDAFCENLEHMASSAIQFKPNEIVLPENFIADCYELQKLMFAIRKYYPREELAAPGHAIMAGPFMYGISSLYGALAQAQRDPELTRNIAHAVSCFNFLKGATLMQLAGNEKN